MKRFLCVLLAVLIAISMCACGEPSQVHKAPVNFYYRSRQIELDSGSSIFSAEKRESFGHQEDYVYLIEEYLRGPTTEKCISPFPAGTTLEQLDLVKDKVLIELSSHISLISGSELSIACVCLARTLSEMTGMKSVRISAKDDLIDGKDFITITEDDYLFTSNDPYILPGG